MGQLTEEQTKHAQFIDIFRLDAPSTHHPSNLMRIGSKNQASDKRTNRITTFHFSQLFVPSQTAHKSRDCTSPSDHKQRLQPRWSLYDHVFMITCTQGVMTIPEVLLGLERALSDTQMSSCRCFTAGR